MPNSLIETLKKAELEHLYLSLSNGGISQVKDLGKLTVNDLNSLNINFSSDRKNLLELVKAIRTGKQSQGKSTKKAAVNRTLRSNLVNVPKVSISDVASLSKNNRSTEIVQIKPRQSNKIKTVTSTRNNLDAYGIPLKNTNQTQPIRCRLNSNLADKITVCVRKRPLKSKELELKQTDIVEIKNRRSLIFNEVKTKVDMSKVNVRSVFMFDETFDSSTTNLQVYKRTAKPLVKHVLQGGKATCFAYGQTGSGKTHTMLDESSGLYVLTAKELLAQLALSNENGLMLTVGFFEIYRGQLYDLLDCRTRLEAREDSSRQVIISGLKEIVVKGVDDLMKCYESGSGVRSTGSTMANSDSSRSHAIMQLSLRPKSNPDSLFGKFSFIDLAGSERGADRGVTDETTKLEGAEINKSLLALKECIRALDQGQAHLPFRSSKLTQVLKESFVGEARTCMIATISPNSLNHEHTLNTLRYADRVKELRGEYVDTESDFQSEVDEVDNPESNGNIGQAELMANQNSLSNGEELESQDELEFQDALEYQEPSIRRDDFTEYVDKSFAELVNNSQVEDLMDLPIPDLGFDIPQLDTFSHQPTSFYPNSSLNQLLPQTSELADTQPNFDGSKYNLETVESVALTHRSLLKTLTECCKVQTTLLTDLSHLMSDHQFTPQQQETGFENYLLDLNDILERKLGIIEDQKAQLAQVMLNAKNGNN